MRSYLHLVVDIGKAWVGAGQPRNLESSVGGRGNPILVLATKMTTTTDTIVEKAESQVHSLADNDVDSVNTNVRYMAYGSRLRTALVASSRYVAYVSEENRDPNSGD